MSTLYVVATPIGNLSDMTFRAVESLKQVRTVYAEDTRRSRVLLDHFGIAKPVRSLHEHNEKQRVNDVLNALADGDVALLTDAGTPAVSDPGAELVAGLASSEHKIVPIPGASALATALSVAGFSEGAVTFYGFLPVKGRERADLVASIANNRGIVVLYEAPHRIGDTLRELTVAEPERPACVCRELTKMHEELARGTVEALAAKFAGEVRGEITIVLGPSAKPETTTSEQDLDAAIGRTLAAGLSSKDTATALAAAFDLPKREVYQRVQLLTKR